jgi:hypothetical protein
MNQGMAKQNPLDRARDALDSIVAVDFSSPTSLEVRLDRLASALMRVPKLQEKLESIGRDSLGAVLDELVSEKMIDDSVLVRFQEVESLLEQVDYDAFEEDAAEELESAVNELHEKIGGLLDKLEEDEE